MKLIHSAGANVVIFSKFHNVYNTHLSTRLLLPTHLTKDVKY